MLVPDFEGVVVRSNSVSTTVQVRGSSLHITLPNDMIQRKEPEHWPPEPGDVWETTNGELFFCQIVRPNGIFSQYMIPVRESESRGYDNDDGFAAFMRLRPVLAYRRPDQ